MIVVVHVGLRKQQSRKRERRKHKNERKGTTHCTGKGESVQLSGRDDFVLCGVFAYRVVGIVQDSHVARSLYSIGNDFSTFFGLQSPKQSGTVLNTDLPALEARCSVLLLLPVFCAQFMAHLC